VERKETDIFADYIARLTSDVSLNRVVDFQ
jgi:hypothetical protein